MKELRLKTTADGSSTIYNEEIDENYHSIHGALQESMHVFIDKGLLYSLNKTLKNENLKILEIGWGTGLNCALSFFNSIDSNIKIEYHGIEPFPVANNLIEKLNFSFNNSDQEFFKALHQLSWNKNHFINSSFSLTKHESTFENFNSLEQFDLIYFDAFAPRKQPELWLKNIFEKIYGLLRADGSLVTYCAKGQVRRDLETVGFSVERLDGPPGKREMIRATKNI